MMRDPTQFRFQMLDELPMRQRLTVAISLAWHQLAIAQGIESDSHKIFVNEVAVLLGWSALEDIISKDHKAREFFRKHAEMEIVVMDETRLSPMRYASFLLPALTVRALEAPTVRAEVYHTLVEAFVKRLWPDMWEAILEVFCRVHMQPAEFRTLMQVPGALAHWIREESGLQVVEFNPPRINNLSRLQDIIDQEREESLEVLSRQSMPNVDYEPPEVISNADFRRGNHFTTDNGGAQVRILADPPIARRLTMDEMMAEENANTRDGDGPPPCRSGQCCPPPGKEC
jgi:hypothetical protein